MRIEIVAPDANAAAAFAEECLVHLARCGVAAARIPDSAMIDIAGTPGPPLVVDAATDPASLLRQLVSCGAIPPAAADDEQLLLTRLVDLGYL